MESFADKLAFVMKALSLSRGRLGSELGIDKSIVSRWFSGARTPSSNNLAALTALIARHRPGFTLLDWDVSLAELQAAFRGGSTPAVDGELSAGGERDWLPVSRAQSVIEVRREGDAYPGVYVGFHLLFRNTGEVAPDLFVIWRDDDRLMFRQFGTAFTHTGGVLILRHQLFIVGEDDTRADGLVSYLFNGVTGEKAIRLDGLVMTVLGDRFRTPTATPLVLQRLADLDDPNAPPSQDDMAIILSQLRAIHGQGQLADLAGPAIMEAIRPVIGSPCPNGGIDHVLRRPGDRALSASELDWTDALDADIRRIRKAVLGASSPLNLIGTYNLARTVT